jgi:hypothetical protein
MMEYKYRVSSVGFRQSDAYSPDLTKYRNAS